MAQSPGSRTGLGVMDKRQQDEWLDSKEGPMHTEHNRCRENTEKIEEISNNQVKQAREKL
jgi:hypothetical protein